VIVEVK